MSESFDGDKNPHITASTAKDAALTKMALAENNTEYREFVDEIPRHVKFFVRHRDESEIGDTITIIKIKINSLPTYADQYKYEIEKYEKHLARKLLETLQ